MSTHYIIWNPRDQAAFHALDKQSAILAAMNRFGTLTEWDVMVRQGWRIMEVPDAGIDAFEKALGIANAVLDHAKSQNSRFSGYTDSETGAELAAQEIADAIRAAASTVTRRNPNRHYGLLVGDLVEQRIGNVSIRGVVTELHLTDANGATIRMDDGKTMKVVCEWCNIIKKVDA
jgi:hypothetical protein